MSTTRVLPRLGVAIGALVAMLGIASPAFAADNVDASISGLSSSLTAGARNPESFQTKLQNQTDQAIQPVRRVLGLRLTGLTVEQVRFSQGGRVLASQAAGAGQVLAVDPLQGRLGPNGKNGDQMQVGYGIQILAGAPSGRAEVTFQAYQGNQLIASTNKSVTIRGGVAQPSSSSSPTPSETTSAVPVPGAAGGTQPAAPPASNPPQASVSNQTTVPVIFYVLGAILVGVGGVILWLLFRPRPALVDGAQVAGAEPPTGPYYPGPYDTVPAPPTDRAPTLGYPKLSPPLPPPRRTANIHPTTVMPTVQDSNTAPPPTDPWASQGGPSNDVTRGFGPPRP